MQQEAVVRKGLTDKTAAQFRQGSLIQQLWETNLEVFQRDKLALFGLVIFAIFAIVALLAPQIAPNDPLTPLKNSKGNWIKDAMPYWLAEAGVDTAEGLQQQFPAGHDQYRARYIFAVGSRFAFRLAGRFLGGGGGGDHWHGGRLAGGLLWRLGRYNIDAGG